MPTASFRIFEHTADIGVEAEGPTLAVTLAHLILGMNQVQAGDADIRSEAAWTAEAEGHDAESLTYNLLAETLFVMETEGILVASAEVTVAPKGPGWAAKARLKGEGHDRKRHSGLQVKAVTYHELSMEETPEGWKARVILDI